MVAMKAAFVNGQSSDASPAKEAKQTKKAKKSEGLKVPERPTTQSAKRLTKKEQDEKAVKTFLASAEMECHCISIPPPGLGVG